MHKAFTLRYSATVNKLIVPVSISLPFNPTMDQGKQPPILIKCNAIWDTGASSSVITKSLAKKVGLLPTGKMLVTNTTSNVLQNTYLVNFYLPNQVAISYVKITECEDVLGDSEVLIGMDIIGAGDFAITSEGGKTVLSYVLPHLATQDYVPLSQQANTDEQRMNMIKNQKEARESHTVSHKVLKEKRKRQRQNKKNARKKKK